jgi:hypothetical protein
MKQFTEKCYSEKSLSQKVCTDPEQSAIYQDVYETLRDHLEEKLKMN